MISWGDVYKVAAVMMLIVGVPMAQAMYGDWAQQIVVQLSVFQAIVWITLLLFALEVRKAALGTMEMCGRAGTWRQPAGRRRRKTLSRGPCEVAVKKK